MHDLGIGFPQYCIAVTAPRSAEADQVTTRQRADVHVRELLALELVADLVSVAIRWPLAGVIWHGINGDGQGWRRDPRLLRAYTWATLLWALVFVARVVVQGLLYRYEEETWLGIARLAMGYPLVGVALLGTIWAVRRARRAPLPAT